MSVTKKYQRVYTFIDSQNLNLAIRNQGWKLDYGRFRRYLKDKYHINQAFLFLGYLPQNETLYQYLEMAGFQLVFKKVLIVRSRKVIKGNVDAELVLHTAKKQFNNYDKAVVVSGDGDFYCLYEFLHQQNKLLKIIVPNENQFSALLRDFSSYLDSISSQRKKLERRQKNWE